MPLYPPTSEPHTSLASPITSSIGTFTVISKTIISAAPAEVLSLIRDTNTWPIWNSFCPAASIHPRKSPVPVCEDINIPTGKEDWLELGSEATIDVYMEGDGLVEGRKRTRTQGLIVTKLEKINEAEEGKKGYRIAWKGVGWSHWQLHSERVLEMVEVEGEGGLKTDYVCWETFGGILGSMVKMMVGEQLVDRFGDYSRDLKRYFEGGETGYSSLNT